MASGRRNILYAQVTFDEMKAMRAAGELKGGGQVPQLHIGDEVLSQSNAIATY